MEMFARYRRRAALAGLALFALALSPTAAAQDSTTAFQGKTVTIVIGYAPGGLYDLTARLLSRHMGRHIPGHPTLVPQNMVGASSYKAIMHLYSVAPKDGTTIGMISRGFANDSDTRAFIVLQKSPDVVLRPLFTKPSPSSDGFYGISGHQ